MQPNRLLPLLMILLLCSSIPFSSFSETSVEEFQISDDLPVPEVYWWSNEENDPHPIEDNAVIEGDLIRLEANFPNDEEYPDNDVVNITWSATRGYIENRTGSLLIPEDEDYDPFFMSFNESYFAWEYVHGISNGDNIQLDLFHSNSDTDVLLFWNETDHSMWSDSTSINLDMVTAALGVESTEFVADRDGVLALAIYCYDKQPGNYTLVIDTRERDTGSIEGNSLSYNTWRWGRNITIDFDFLGIMANGDIMKVELQNITFRNFFKPIVTNVNVQSQGRISQITWDVLDRNQFESHYYEVLVSLDGGFSFQLLATGLENNIYSWDIDNFGNFDRCQVQIRAFDDVGLQGVGYSPIFVVSNPNLGSNGRWFTATSRGNLTYVWGTSGHEVTWDVLVVDNTPLLYEVFLDSSIILTGWVNGGEITVGVDGLDLGTHQAVLVIETFNSKINDTVLIEVIQEPGQLAHQSLTTISAFMIVLSGIIVVEIRRKTP